MKIKKGKLNYDQSGRAYPDNPRLKENWDSIWEYEGKYYKLVGDNEHKEWDEVNIYNQMIDEAYENYYNYMTTNFMETRWCKVEISPDGKSIMGRMCNRDEFIIESKTQPGFSERWGLKIEERELSKSELNILYNIRRGVGKVDTNYSIGTVKSKDPSIPTKLITITYNNETIESYE
jgi:hypothetical protein